MYGLWLYKEFATEYGRCRVEIKQQNYSGNAIEIESFAANSLSVSMQNLSEIISPIGKSVCSLGIINTGQFDYDVLFTPNAIKYLVTIQTKIDGGEWQSRWGGFLTPDFFAEDLRYRSIINLSARDNIGRLNDLPFDYTEYGLIKISELFNTAFNRISSEYPMDIVIDTKKLIDGKNLTDAYVSVDVFKGKSWGEALEIVLHDCGLQMRWVDNNTIKVYDLAYMPQQYTSQEVFFVQSSGYREILPAWRSLAQSQDYIGKGNLYDGVANAELMVLDHTEAVYYPSGGGSPQKELVNYYKLLSDWSTAWNAYTAKNMDAPLSGVYISGINTDDPGVIAQNYIGYRVSVKAMDYPLSVILSTSKTIHRSAYPSLSPDTIAPYDLYNAADTNNTGYVQLSIHVSIILHADNGKSYYLGRRWEEFTDGNIVSPMKFILNKATYGNIDAEDITITANSIPYNGRLEIRLHGYRMEDFKYVRVNNNYPYPDWEAFFAKIEDIKIEPKAEFIPSGLQFGVLINENYNVKRNESYTISTLPIGIGGESIVVNGLYDSDGNTLYKAKLGENPEEYKLIELVGREAIHYNIKNYEKLSGTVKSAVGEPLRFDRLYNFNGKRYIPYAYELSIISNIMNITTMQEVDDYRVASLVEEESEVSTGISNVGLSGDNLILQYSENAGNAKRIYELETATEEEAKESYLLLDKQGNTEAKKILAANIFEMSDWFALRTLSNGKKVLYTKYGIAMDGEISVGGISDDMGGDSGDSYSRLDSWDNYNPANGDVLSAVLGYGLKTDIQSLQEQINNMGGGGLSSVTVKIGNTAYDSVDGVVSLPSYPVVPTLLSEFTDDVVAGHYLPIEGGYFANSLNYKSTSAFPLILGSTVSAEQSVILLRHNDVDKAQVGWTNASGTYLYNYVSRAKLGINNNGVAYFNDYTLLHSGNIGDQSVASAYKIITSGRATDINISDVVSCKYLIASAGVTNGPWSTQGVKILHFAWDSGVFASQLAIGVQAGYEDATNPANYRLAWRAQKNAIWGDWKYVAFTDSNVASATKLETARTIWGMSFDGTQDLSGALTIANNAGGINIKDTAGTSRSVVELNAGNNLFFGYATAGAGYHSYYCGNVLMFLSGTSRAEAMRIEGNGNVGIGTNNPKYKLDVNGSAAFGNSSACDVWLRRANGNSYITATSSLMFSVNGSSSNYAFGIDTSKNATFYGNISATGSITIGGATLTWDETNNCLRVNTNLAADGELTAGGVSDAAVVTEYDSATEIAELNRRITELENRLAAYEQ